MPRGWQSTCENLISQNGSIPPLFPPQPLPCPTSQIHGVVERMQGIPASYTLLKCKEPVVLLTRNELQFRPVLKDSSFQISGMRPVSETKEILGSNSEDEALMSRRYSTQRQENTNMTRTVLSTASSWIYSQ